MDGDWNEVKAKPKKHRKPKQEDDDAYSYGGGFGQGGMLKAGAVKNVLTLGGPKHVAQHSASARTTSRSTTRDSSTRWQATSVGSPDCIGHSPRTILQVSRQVRSWFPERSTVNCGF